MIDGMMREETAVQAAAPLLDWLRGMPSDTDFTSAVEMALGRGEMDDETSGRT